MVGRLFPLLFLSACHAEGQQESQPGGQVADKPLYRDPVHDGADESDARELQRSSIQVAELELPDDRLTCDRDRPVHISLSVRR